VIPKKTQTATNNQALGHAEKPVDLALARR